MEHKLNAYCYKASYHGGKNPPHKNTCQCAPSNGVNAFYNAYAHDGPDYRLGGSNRYLYNGIDMDGNGLGQEYYQSGEGVKLYKSST
jgi:hypothetical protein